MTRYNRPNPVARILPILIILGVLIGVGYVWGEEILRFVTGQDILEEMMVDFLPSPTPVPDSPAPLATQPATGGEVAPVVPALAVELGPDGFPVQPRQHVLKYTVQPGDALFAIAERFGIHPNTIFWANTGTLQDNVHLIQVGLQLYILPENGVYHESDGTQTIAEIASLYGVTGGEILYSPYNQLSQYDSQYVPPVGLRIVVPNGRRDYISWKAPIATGTESGATNPEGPIHPGSCRARYVGTGGSGLFENPLPDIPYRVTNGFAGWHPGVDLAADRGTSIYAAETGVVVFAGWHRDGYGELIIIDHGEGWTTYYGHLARRFVGCGDQISRGQFIAEMGLSGNATGVHLHFEVRQGDVPQNPYSFITITDERVPGN